MKEQLAEKKSHNDTRKEFDAKGHGNQHERPPHQLLEPIQQGHDCFSLAFGRSSQIVVPNMGLAVCYSLAHDGQDKGTNHGTDKLPGMVEFPIGEQKGDAIRRASREQRRLEPAHRHRHGHSTAKVHPIVTAFNVDGHGHGRSLQLQLQL